MMQSYGRGVSRSLLAISILVVALTPGGLVEAVAEPGVERISTQSGWEVYDSPSLSSLYSIDMVDASNGWIGATGGQFLRFDGTDWVTAPQTLDDVTNAIAMVNPNYGWGVTYKGRVIVYNGTDWQTAANFGPGALMDLALVDTGGGWAVSQSGEILRFDGANWFVYTTMPNSFYAIDMVSDNDGWMVGSAGVTAHWNGYSWLVVGSPVDVWFRDIDMVTSDDGWAVGNAGVIFHYDGSTWAPTTSPTTKGLRAVQMLASDNGWAVGDDGVILHYDGQAWAEVASPTSQTLYNLYMLNENEGWAVGRWGTMLRYRGAPDLSTSTKTFSTRRPAPGEVVTTSVYVRNSGSAVASSVVVTDSIPAHTTYVVGSATTTQGTIQGPDPLVVDVGDVGPGGEVAISFQVTVGDPGEACWIITNEATIASNTSTLFPRATMTVGTCHAQYLPLILR